MFSTKFSAAAATAAPRLLHSTLRQCIQLGGNRISTFPKGVATQAVLLSSRTKSTTAASITDVQEFDAFPSIVIGAKGRIEPQGSFAEAQAQYLDPDPDAVTELSHKLTEANMGIVAHYYMDVELQGVLQAVGREQQSISGSSTPRVGIADSLSMGDHAVKMCEDGATSIACLGVDFMAESVSAILDRNGFGHVPVYRATHRAIGCSLAESAERDSYRAWLHKASEAPKALHVVYINTSLETKAVSSHIVPTITCTSSNVLRTMLQASAQLGPDLQIYYGPDTYMGENLVSFMDAILHHGEGWSDERIKNELHPHHDRQTLRALKDSIRVFPNGNCVVHHMFGSEVVDIVKKHYEDAYVTAHLEVPGEMFEIAMEKSLVGMGTVGSTSDILKFISAKVAEAAGSSSNNGERRRLKFILGTEAGMVTSIVRSVHDILETSKSGNNAAIEAEIVFPVAAEAVTAVEDDNDLAIVPGVSGGEGCSTAGGCATCPFMKMNDLDALLDVIDMVLNSNETNNATKLRGHLPPDRLRGKMLGDKNAMDLGTEPILYMRQFMKDQSLPDELVQRIMATAAS